jgi:hypothetical protein
MLPHLLELALTALHSIEDIQAIEAAVLAEAVQPERQFYMTFGPRYADEIAYGRRVALTLDTAHLIMRNVEFNATAAGAMRLVDPTYPSPRTAAAWKRLRDLKARHADRVLKLARTAMQWIGEIEAMMHAEEFDVMPCEGYQSLATSANIVFGVVKAAETAAAADAAAAAAAAEAAEAAEAA